MPPNSPPDYRSYLLRLWRADAASPWRATLEDVHSGRRRGFATLAQLAAFLEGETVGERPSSEEKKGGSG
jgi:hypothetical protein